MFLKLSFLNLSFYIYISEYGFLRSSLTYNICSTVFEKPETECVPIAPLAVGEAIGAGGPLCVGGTHGLLRKAGQGGQAGGEI